jgi:hypothetical protein
MFSFAVIVTGDPENTNQYYGEDDAVAHPAVADDRRLVVRGGLVPNRA